MLYLLGFAGLFPLGLDQLGWFVLLLLQRYGQVSMSP